VRVKIGPMSEPHSVIGDAAARGVERFAAGFNCAESVLLGVTGALGCVGDGVPMVATGFGGGVARRGEICGAVTGAVMAIGLCRGRSRAEDLDARDRTYAAVDGLLSRFSERHGSLTCRELIGCDLSTVEGRNRAAELRTHQDVCPKFVASAAALAVEAITPEG